MNLSNEAKSVLLDSGSSSVLETPKNLNDIRNANSLSGYKEETTNSSYSPNPQFHNNTKYAGDAIEEVAPLRDSWDVLPFPNPAFFVAFYNQDIASGKVTLHGWQTGLLEQLGSVKPTAQHPYKHILCTCNGSGKDAFIIASFVAWFCACKKRSRCIITSSSGVQLTSQTEGYIRSLCQKVNEFHGQEVFRIRQRYITCRLSGSEIRLFATDEEGKAEGYHPMEPYAEMAIVVNEGKSVSEEIHGALRRCTGYNYWLEVSTPGEPTGFFYRAFCTWPNKTHVDFSMCPHVSYEDLEQDKIDLGEHSPLYRSKWLALFTSLSTDTVIPQDLVDSLLNPNLREYFSFTFSSFEERVGIDLAAGGDENSICKTKGNKCLKQVHFRETDTELAADRIVLELKAMGISKDCKHIYADDGGVGRSIIDKLVKRGWHINRVLNQHPAIAKGTFGNRGAENWFRVKRIIEERFFDISTLDAKTREQLYTRHWRGKLNGAKLFLESKKEAKAEGRPSPDRADAFILSMTGVTVDDYIKYNGTKDVPHGAPKKVPVKLHTQEEVEEYYDNITYQNFDKVKKPIILGGRKLFNSLSTLLPSRKTPPKPIWKQR